MADRLQKTLEVGASVASAGNPTPPSTRLAENINTIGSIASSVILDKKKENLEKETRQLGEEVFAAATGGDLDDATARFTRLKKAQEQGVLSDSMINIEAEKILKQKIGNNSVFAPELRAEAARILGFDPTGSEIQSLFAPARSGPSRTMTPQEKRRQEAEGLAADLGLNPDDVVNMMAKGELAQLQVSSATAQAGLGQIGSREVLNNFMDGIDSYVSDAHGDLLSEIQAGGVVSPEMAVAKITQVQEAAWVGYRKALKGGQINLSASDLSEQRAVFDKQFENIKTMYGDEATLDTILNRQKSSLSATAAIHGFQAFPGLAAINEGMGQAGVQEYLKLSSSMSDPAMFELLKKNNPGLAAIADNRGSMQKAMTASYNRIMGLPTEVDSPNIPGLDDQVSRNLTTNAEEADVREALLKSIQTRGQFFKDVGDYAQPGTRTKVTQSEVKYVQDKWATEYEPLLARVASESKRDPNVNLVVRDGIIFPDTTRTFTTEFGESSTTSAPSSVLMNDVKRLNAMNKLVQNGWAADVGEQSFGFSERTLNKIETLKADSEPSGGVDHVGVAINAFSKVPSPENFEAIRSIDPKLAADVEAELSRRGGTTDGQ